MEELIRTLLDNSSGVFSYGAVFAILVVCGLGVPLPEDVSLILGGFLVFEGHASLPWMMFTGFAGILVGDSLIFGAGRRLGTRARRRETGLLSRVVTPEKRARVEALFSKHGEKIVMIARFLPGVRAVTYFTAGSAGMRYWRFILFDGLAALASAPLFVYLGYRFGDRLEQLLQMIKRGQVRVIVALLLVGAAYLLVKLVLKRRRERAAAAAQAPLPAAGDPHRNVVQLNGSRASTPVTARSSSVP